MLIPGYLPHLGESRNNSLPDVGPGNPLVVSGNRVLPLHMPRRNFLLYGTTALSDRIERGVKDRERIHTTDNDDVHSVLLVTTTTKEMEEESGDAAPLSNLERKKKGTGRHTNTIMKEDFAQMLHEKYERARLLRLKQVKSSIDSKPLRLPHLMKNRLRTRKQRLVKEAKALFLRNMRIGSHIRSAMKESSVKRYALSKATRAKVGDVWRKRKHKLDSERERANEIIFRRIREAKNHDLWSNGAMLLRTRSNAECVGGGRGGGHSSSNSSSRGRKKNVERGRRRSRYASERWNMRIAEALKAPTAYSMQRAKRFAPRKKSALAPLSVLCVASKREGRACRGVAIRGTGN